MGVTVAQPTHKIGTGSKIVYCRYMTKTQMTETLQDLQDFMFDTMASQEMAVKMIGTVIVSKLVLPMR